MGKLWEGRASGKTDAAADDFNSSISFDKRMYKQDIAGSIAHAEMLAHRGIISASDAEAIVSGLADIAAEIESGKLAIDPESEDIHTFVETELTSRINDAGKKLHTARSRNDQVALDLRMYLRDETAGIISLIKKLALTVTGKADEYSGAIMPGYTHLQRAQPVTFGHHLMAYVMMLLRDVDRLSAAARRMNVSPIGSLALAGGTYDTDRFFEAEKLGFSDVCRNSMDGVSDRDFCIELTACLSIVMMHLSRFAEEVILWTSSEFHFVELSDAFTTGSSIMPQKKNSDMAELVRGKTGRVYGDLVALLTMMKGLPLAYNKDMQEDKESVFDACDTVKACLGVFDGMIGSMKVNESEMYKAAQKGFINATDLADYLTKKGVPFRTAYKIAGATVAYCISAGKVLEELTLAELKEKSELFEADVYDAIDLKNCVARRISYGGTSEESVKAQITYAREKLSEKIW